jgi:hypothetical protein
MAADEKVRTGGRYFQNCNRLGLGTKKARLGGGHDGEDCIFVLVHFHLVFSRYLTGGGSLLINIDSIYCLVVWDLNALPSELEAIRFDAFEYAITRSIDSESCIDRIVDAEAVISMD